MRDKIMLHTKAALLQGLGDADPKNRWTVQNFWSDVRRLPEGTLEAMYSPQTESRYLSYATNLLLEMTSKSPDYQQEIFEKPLSECKFQVRLCSDYTCTVNCFVCIYKICRFFSTGLRRSRILEGAPRHHDANVRVTVSSW